MIARRAHLIAKMFRKKKDTMADMKEKLSRIKFINVDREAPKMRRDDSDLLRDIDDYEDSRKFSADSLGQYDTALDSHTCFHRDCCFAYNITVTYRVKIITKSPVNESLSAANDIVINIF